MAAAVADYRPENTANQKIKKNAQSLHIQLSPTTDILGWMGENKAANQYLVGFALETDQEEKNALAKRARKNLDLIVLNSLKDEGAGFGHDTNVVYLYNHREEKTTISLRSKDEIASEIVQYLHAALA